MNRIKVIVCDDEQKCIDEICKYLKEFSNINLFCYNSLEDLKLNCKSADIAFLDIKIGDKSGFDAAEYLKSINKNCVLTFFTNYSDYMKRGYEYRIYRYILKEEPPEFIIAQIRDTIDEYYRTNNFLKIDSNVIDVRKMTHISVNNHKAILHFSDNSIVGYYTTLDNIEDMLSAGEFVRCHKSYIVIINFVDEIKSNSLIIINKTKIPIGRKYKNSVFSLFRK